MTQKEWKAEVKKQMSLAEMTRDDLAEKTGYSTGYVAHAICGDMRAPRVVEAISIVLGIEPYTE